MDRKRLNSRDYAPGLLNGPLSRLAQEIEPHGAMRTLVPVGACVHPAEAISAWGEVAEREAALVEVVRRHLQ